ncbi:MAG: hypothetical protein JSR33_02915 [Proteobacteria bacterium]|nr:hypothetical protein [Pseudomonadota bacterium]
MADIILNHPALIHSQDMETICRPLTTLGITYFAHVNVTKQGHFSGISNNAKFAEHYLKNKYYNADIHLAKKHNLGCYILWDSLERIGLSEKMHTEAAQFGVRHTFTIIEKKHLHSNFYHFATHLKNNAINQIYIENIDLLQRFILYFNKVITSSSTLNKAYDIIFKLDHSSQGYTIKEDHKFSKYQDKRLAFINDIQELERNDLFNSSPIASLSPQQHSCLKLLSEGYSAKKIAAILHLSSRTVENYLSNLRVILKCRSSKELIAFYYSVLKNTLICSRYK